MKGTAKSELFRELPSVDELLRTPGLAGLAAEDGMAAVTEAARAVLARLRQGISSGLLDQPALQLALEGMLGAIGEQLRQTLRYSLRPVINATGVILHTNLGRAPLAEAALAHIGETAGHYSNLEFEIEAGVRGKRDVHVERLFQRLLAEGQEFSAGRAGAPAPPHAQVATIVVNNNAAAVLLALNTLAEDGEVIVSRGELVEIGGSFRIPDVMAKSGAVLREVGTTNRTRIADYEKAINERTRLLLRVHRSNFEITGFTAHASTAELVELARQRGLPLMEDLGSGALVDLATFGVAGEPSVLDSLRAGMDVVTYSGDKLLGGPQSGLISGRADLVARMRANSLFRALRVDKVTYAALEATLLAYVKHDHDAVPALRMMRITKEEIGRRAEAVAERVRSAENPHVSESRRGAPTKLTVEVIDGESVIGGGAAPSAVLPTRLLALSCEGLSADELSARLRGADPPVIGRVEDGRVLLDLRTVFVERDQMIAAVLERITS
ncbi:L-seryl-tRNA(Sec) selenium transferase [Candidatus Sulfotelmatobacter kueseliae]|uniref:L-seryl-tRNA(Sec) selenium transferase n=1 Tax=Candidatus Sulfotelmatobacter kueseliae TaxID=2042962 RepID=A0A2U3KYC1_9BACT|nr:L-seryl-tRNA(Sec) selenium transferase [Candidatus Sulfotelmatobacter kueseliae]